MRWLVTLALALAAISPRTGSAQEPASAVTLHAIRGPQGRGALRVLRRCLEERAAPAGEGGSVEGWGRLRYRRATGWELLLFLRSDARRWRHRERRPTLRALLRAASRGCARWTAPPRGRAASDARGEAREDAGEPARSPTGRRDARRRGRAGAERSGERPSAGSSDARRGRGERDAEGGRAEGLLARERGTGARDSGARANRPDEPRAGARGPQPTTRAEHEPAARSEREGSELEGREVVLGLGGGLFFRGLSGRGADPSRADHRLIGPRVQLDARVRGGRGPLGRLSGQLQLGLGVATATRDAMGALHPTRHHAVDAHLGVDLRRTARTRVALRVGGHSQRVRVDDGADDATLVPDRWYRAASLGALLDHSGARGGLRLALGLRWPFRVAGDRAEGAVAAGLALQAEARLRLAPGLALSLGGRFEPTFVWRRQQLGELDAEAGAQDLTGLIEAALLVRWPSR